MFLVFFFFFFFLFKKKKKKKYRDIGSNFVKHNELYSHYDSHITREDGGLHGHHAGCYGPYWTAHIGGGYLKFLRRRSSKPSTYNHKNPVVNFYRRKLDERAIHWEFPRGQDYQIVIKWFLQVIAVSMAITQFKNIKSHFDNHKPLPPPDTYPYRINVPFTVYIIHEQEAPNLEVV